MKHAPETYGDAVEHNRVMHEEALRRAHARNVADESAVDLNVYSEAERAHALPAPESQLNWNSGDITMTPSAVPSTPLTGLHSAPRADSGVCGVEAIANFTTEGRGR